MSKKSRKRLDALSEVIIESDAKEDVDEVDSDRDNKEVDNPSEQKNDGIFGKVQEFYQKADSMAQSQALLLNKELEDKGVIEKITDETGLKVIGKEAASKLQNKKNESKS